MNEQEQPTDINEDFAQTLEYRRIATPDEIISDMERLGQMDKAYEAKERFWLILAIIATVLSVLTVFFAFPLVAGGERLWYVPVPVVIVVATIVAWILKRRRGRFNLEDRRYRLVAEVLPFLALDIPSDRPVAVAIDFNDYHQKKYQAASEGGMVSATHQYAYSLPWLRLEGALCDGSRFRLAATMVVKRKERRKRKHTKVKEAFRDNITLALRVKPNRYAGLERAAELIAEADALEGINFKGARVDGPRVILSAVTDRKVRVKARSGTTGEKGPDQVTSRDAILSLFLAVYHALGQCRPTRPGA